MRTNLIDPRKFELSGLHTKKLKVTRLGFISTNVFAKTQMLDFLCTITQLTHKITPL